jgi:hypothetical protein
MTVPGFTGGSSLSKTHAQYYSGPRAFGDGRAIVPQFPGWVTCGACNPFTGLRQCRAVALVCRREDGGYARPPGGPVAFPTVGAPRLTCRRKVIATWQESCGVPIPPIFATAPAPTAPFHSSETEIVIFVTPYL